MATTASVLGEFSVDDFEPGVLAGVEISDEPDLKLTDLEISALKDLASTATRRDYPARLIEVIAAWEPLDVLTPVATPCGWKTMGSLRAGDYVFGSNGRIASVTHAHPIQEQKSYSIFFSDGTSIIAGEKHSWMTTTCKERSVGKQDKERTTKELFETQDRQHAIRMMPGLQTFDTQLPIDPYMLGCWLGDGIAKTGEICGGEIDLSEIISHAPDAKIRKKVSRAYGNYCLATVKGLRDGLYRMGLLGNKRIPEIYLRASHEQRLALLQGLMDTDGWATSNGGCGWGQFKGHRALIDGFSELLSSLGIKHQFYAYQRKRENGEPFEFWQTTFYSDLQCFRLKRKADRQQKAKSNRAKLLYITGVEEVGMRNVRCITVDTPDHLFLAGKSMVPTHNCALFYRGFQFLIPMRGGGWEIPGESTGYGPSMQLDLALLPTNIYSTYAQILISTLTRAVPSVRFQPQNPSNAAEITAVDSAGQYTHVIERNNDLIMIQTDACRYLWTDGRAMYWSRFVQDGQRFGWVEEQDPNDLVPENEPSEEQADEYLQGKTMSEVMEEDPDAMKQEPSADDVAAMPNEAEDEEEESEGKGDKAGNVIEFPKRTPNGAEVRTAHGKLEVKLTPMSANSLSECHALQYETEVDVTTAKGMWPKKAEKIRAGGKGVSEAEIARLARQNVKLGMQSTYVTSDSMAQDVTIQRNWFRPSYLMKIENKVVRDSLLKKSGFEGILITFAGDEVMYARKESMDDSWALMQAYAGDGQNRNALGTSLMPIQKRLNNWLDLMNDLFIRCIPKKWMHNRAFDVEAIRSQTNIPGDVGSYKPQPGMTADELVFVEPGIEVPTSLPEFIKSYSGELAELLTGAYPALSGGDTGSNDTAHGIAIQRDQALGRIGPTWHQLQNAEAASIRQLVRWAAKCRTGSINEFVEGSEPIRIEIGNLKANILCFPESDENFPETHTQKQNRLLTFMQDAVKNPQLGEALYNPANIDYLLEMVALTDLYIPQVASYQKQQAEIELMLKTIPVPNPKIQQGAEMLQQMETMGVDPQMLLQAKMQLQQMAKQNPVVSSMPIDSDTEDNQTEAFACWRWLNSPEGRKAKRTKPQGYENIRLHFIDHKDAATQAAGQAQAGKPPSISANYKDVNATDPAAASQILAKAGIQPSGQAQLPAPGGAAAAA